MATAISLVPGDVKRPPGVAVLAVQPAHVSLSVRAPRCRGTFGGSLGGTFSHRSPPRLRVAS